MEKSGRTRPVVVLRYLMRSLELNATLSNPNIQHMIRLMDQKQTAS
ncbi:hypothetical protein [Photobacterium lipolyticum]|nr:hypothetical protein [Photobacterium lipolyticum]